tara:strand:- start:427 stop:591 length:165 start_codon:yes stop_codon:yes gene_type:complete
MISVEELRFRLSTLEFPDVSPAIAESAGVAACNEETIGFSALEKSMATALPAAF